MCRLLALLALVVVLAALLPPGDPPAGPAPAAGLENRRGDPIPLDRAADDERWPVWDGLARARRAEAQLPPAPPVTDR